MPIKTVELLEGAAADYDAAFDWYLARSPEAALAFDMEFERALGEIARAPERWALGAYQTRRFLLRRFPYLVIYREHRDAVLVVAVAHTSRKPGYWRDRR
ncbi:MAG TPA: type II toxin-antitoxin system RelE/ParE family toxin [Terriglobales bacterium]